MKDSDVTIISCQCSKLVAAEKRRDSLQYEITAALKVLNPAMPESGIEDACEQFTLKNIALNAEISELQKRVKFLQESAGSMDISTEAGYKREIRDLEAEIKSLKEEISLLKMTPDSNGPALIIYDVIYKWIGIRNGITLLECIQNAVKILEKKFYILPKEGKATIAW